MISLAHEVPGRIRFVASHARHDRRAAAGLRRRARSIPGVKLVTLNPITGSLIVHYTASDETRGRVLAALMVDTRAIAPASPAWPKSPRAWLPEADRLADCLAKAVARELVERMVRMAIMALI
jgi:threonine aldolase